MEVAEIQKILERPATEFTAGGFRPSNLSDESWLGKVFLYGIDEEIPKDSNGDLMMPMAQFYLPNLPYVPEHLKDIELLTLFVSHKTPEPFEPMGANWLIREYDDISSLKRKELTSDLSFIKAFPLKAELVEKDYPLWDSECIPYEIAKEILALESTNIIETYYDIIEHTYGHKIGGYPSFCQSGVDFGENFEFVFQISSDDKIDLNVVDNGSLMFAKNKLTGEWVLYYDFY